jgi:hypothetical protein
MSKRPLLWRTKECWRHAPTLEKWKSGVQERYVARLLEREHETGPSREELELRAASTWNDALTHEKIRFFVQFGGMSDLRAWQVEAQLTHLHMLGAAVLNENRQVDRQHACAALAYCEVFATNDRELLNRSRDIAASLNYQSAELLGPEELIQRL